MRILKVEKPTGFPKDSDEFYRLLTNRNFHFVSPKAQAAIRKLKVLVAGCGSGGGACAEPLVRLGVTQMRLADSGSYELTNFNRQRAYVENIGENKAQFLRNSLDRVNPYGSFQEITDGLTAGNIQELVQWADLIFDCVDVTARDALRMKIKLHESAHSLRKPVFVPLDLGYCQTGMGIDYRQARQEPLLGKAEQALACEHPVKSLLAFFPLSRFPGYTLPLLEDALRKKPHPISQMGCASDLLSSVAAAATVRFAEHGDVLKAWHVDFNSLIRSPWRELLGRLKAPWQRRRVRVLLKGIR